MNFCLKEIKVSRQRKVKSALSSGFGLFLGAGLELIRQFRNNINSNEIETAFSCECSLIQKKKGIQFISWPVKTKQDL